MKSYNTILTEKQQKYQHYHLEKLININIDTGEEIIPPDRRRGIEQANFAYSLLGKAYEKQTKKMKNKERTIWSSRS